MPLVFDQTIEECVSTNDLAKDLGRQGAPSGAWISARRQTGGRGRLGRRWESEEGNLFFSMIARGVPKGSITWTPLVAGIACARAVTKAVPELRVQLKWPNDLQIDGAKLGGILCEAVEDFVVIGIGINCASSPEGLDQETTSLTREAEHDVNVDELRPVILEELRLALIELVVQGWRHVADEYENRAALSPGTQVEWAGHRGRVLGLGESGELRVRRSDGTSMRLFAEDVNAVREG